MKIMSTGTSVVEDDKEQLKDIYNGYKNTIPSQSNMFSNILLCYRKDLLDNVNDVDEQMRAMKNSLTTILLRYKYTEVNIETTFNNDFNTIELTLNVVNSNGTTIDLADSLSVD